MLETYRWRVVLVIGLPEHVCVMPPGWYSTPGPWSLMRCRIYCVSDPTTDPGLASMLQVLGHRYSCEFRPSPALVASYNIFPIEAAHAILLVRSPSCLRLTCF
jgi:hypothetical protein